MGNERNQMGLDITYDQSKLKVVKLGDVRPNSWNPKEKDHENIKKIEQNIKRIGFNEPIRVRENDGFEIIDGEQRWTAARNLGLEEVVIYNEGKLTDEEARAATLWWQVQVPFDDIKLAYEVAQLANEDVEIPFTDDEINEFKAVAEFDFDYDTELDLSNAGNKDDITTLSIPIRKVEELVEYAKSLDDGSEQGSVGLVVKENIRVTKEQLEVINMAIDRVKDESNNKKGRAIELICAEFLGK